MTLSIRNLPGDVVMIEGVRYSEALFRGLGVAPIGSTIRIIHREDGVLTLKIVDSVHAFGDRGGLESAAEIAALRERISDLESEISELSEMGGIDP